MRPTGNWGEHWFFPSSPFSSPWRVATQETDTFQTVTFLVSFQGSDRAFTQTKQNLSTWVRQAFIYYAYTYWLNIIPLYSTIRDNRRHICCDWRQHLGLYWDSSFGAEEMLRSWEHWLLSEARVQFPAPTLQFQGIWCPCLASMGTGHILAAHIHAGKVPLHINKHC